MRISKAFHHTAIFNFFLCDNFILAVKPEHILLLSEKTGNPPV